MATLICERIGNDVRIMQCRDYVDPRDVLKWTNPIHISRLIDIGEVQRFGASLDDIEGLASRLVPHRMPYKSFVQGNGYPHPIDKDNFVYLYDVKWYIGKPLSGDTAFPQFEPLADMIMDPYEDPPYPDQEAVYGEENECDSEMDVFNHIGWHERF